MLTLLTWLCTHSYIDIHTHTHTNTPTYTHTHTHTHTHTQANSNGKLNKKTRQTADHQLIVVSTLFIPSVQALPLASSPARWCAWLVARRDAVGEALSQVPWLTCPSFSSRPRGWQSWSRRERAAVSRPGRLEREARWRALVP